MKLRKGDKVLVIAGKYAGKTGEVLAAIPAENKVLVENVNVVKRHTKPTEKNPRGGIFDITKPIDASKVMAIDPATGKPARIGFSINASGVKERIFKVSKQRAAVKTEKKAEAKKADKPAAKAAPKADKAPAEKKPAAKKPAAKKADK